MIEIPMTQAQFDAKRGELKAEEGIDLVGMTGSISKYGVSGTYTYDGTKLKVLITSKPLLFSKSFCEKKLLAWLGTN